MFTEESLKKTFDELINYEREHFGGMKYGPEYAQIAQILIKNEHFMALGGVAMLIAALETSTKAEQAKTNPEKAAEEFLKKPSAAHEFLAQMFYLGYKLGKSEAEKEVLERMMSNERNPL